MQSLYEGSELELKPDKKSKKIAYFLDGLFRPRGKDELAEIISGENKGSPWLFLRVLFIGFLLFAVNVIVYRLTQMAVSYVTCVVLGGLVFNLAVLTLFYELYPKSDLKFITLLSVTLLGGALTVALLSLGYEFIYSGENDSPWISMLWTGFWEELVKAVFALLAVLLLKKKDPLACFMIGFAVGTGYSIFEDISYIYTYSRVDRVYWIVLMSVGRGLSCAFSHAPWTGAICWAFARFKKPFLNFRFYLIFIVCAVLHYLADVPFFAEEVMFLTGFNFGWLMEAVVVAGIVALMYFIFRDRAKPAETPTYPRTYRQKLSYSANLTAVFCAVVLCGLSLFGCAVKQPYVNEYETFSNPAEFVQYVQNGLPLKADLNRSLSDENYAEYTVGDKLRYFTQVEEVGGYKYYYMYGAYVEKTEEEEREVICLDGVAVKIEEDGEEQLYYLNRLAVYENDYTVRAFRPYNYSPVPPESAGNIKPPSEDAPAPEFTVEYFMLAGNGVSYSADEKLIAVNTGVKQLKHTGLLIALGCTQAVILAGGAVAFTVLKIKSRRK